MTHDNIRVEAQKEKRVDATDILKVLTKKGASVRAGRKAVRDAMLVLFDLLKNESHPAVRAVLGHFFFVFIHPYMDGNGRMGRFILNAMLASGGYNWTVVPVERRKEYMNALEKASVGGNIVDFTKVIASLIK
ncbi:MAG: Fic family protein [Parabacteroides sp.]|nr:Fic family protein [Parabacteroides sp.]